MRLLETTCVINQAGREQSIRSALSRGLPECKEATASGIPLAVVASGPSLNEYREELKAFDGKIWAINGAYDYLVESFGIVPDGFVGLDPQEDMVRFLSKPHRKTTFYIASCSHPAVFDRLADYDVRLWHSNSDTISALPSGTMVVPGGVTCVTRAPVLGALLGHRQIRIYGADCSYAPEFPYAYGGEKPESETKLGLRVQCPPLTGKVFHTEAGFLNQASNISAMILVLQKHFGCNVEVRCKDTLIEAFLSHMCDPDKLEEQVNGKNSD